MHIYEEVLMGRAADKSERLYDRVADRVAKMIDKGALKPGDRIPSIRRMSKQMSVAISTVLHAYQILEDRGLIEARAKAGFFVRPKHTRFVAQARPPMEPEMLRLPLKAGRVKVGDIQMVRAQSIGDQASIALGMALPSPEFLPTDAINRHLSRAARLNGVAASQYTLTPGLEALRARVAQRAMDSGCNLGPEEIVITNGTTEALGLALRAVTEPGDTVAVESPCYFGFLSLIKLLSLKVVEVSTDPRDGISLHELEKLMNHRKLALKAILLNPNVHNPLGSIMPDENKRRIVELTTSANVAVIEDDTYGELAFDAPRPSCIKSFDRKDNVILCSSFSKTLAPGYRVGWIAAARWRSRVNDSKRHVVAGDGQPATTGDRVVFGEWWFRCTPPPPTKVVSRANHVVVGCRPTAPSRRYSGNKSQGRTFIVGRAT